MHIAIFSYVANEEDADANGFLPEELSMVGEPELRLKKGYTNYEFFAYENKVGRSQYAKYEKGTDMHFSSILKIIEAHGMTVKEFFSEGFDSPKSL